MLAYTTIHFTSNTAKIMQQLAGRERVIWWLSKSSSTILPQASSAHSLETQAPIRPSQSGVSMPSASIFDVSKVDHAGRLAGVG
jgi:hypothetical protein